MKEKPKSTKTSSDLEEKLIEEANKRFAERKGICEDYWVLPSNIKKIGSKSFQDLRNEGLLECMACGS